MKKLNVMRHQAFTVFLLAFASVSSGLLSADDGSVCHGHGTLYHEDVVLGLPAACECHKCYEGKQCQTPSKNCQLEKYKGAQYEPNMGDFEMKITTTSAHAQKLF